MPLFFTISGMFAVGAVRRPWRVLGRSKVARFLYLYTVWLLIHTALLALVPDFDTARATGPLDLLAQLTITPSNLWYLYALALYFAIAKAARRLPAAPVLGAALALSAVASAGLLEIPGNRGGLYQNLVFFLAGLYFRPLVERLAATAPATPGRARRLLRRRPPGHDGHRRARLARRLAGGCVLATILGVTAAAQISRWAPLGDALARLGRNTLPVYIIHMPLLALLHQALLPALSAGMDGRLRLLLTIAEPLLMSALLVWLCLTLHQGLLRSGATWLFDLPKSRGPREASEPAGHETSVRSVIEPSQSLHR